MVVICIAGTSGAGTSFLVKQLASKECLPAFFEGEVGTIPKEIFESVFNGEPPQKRCEWYVNRYIKNFNNAIAVSKSGIDCYVDGAPMTVYANINLEKEKYIDDLIKIAKKVDNYNIDKIILLTISEERLREFLEKRGRREEPIEDTVARSLKLQEQLIALSRKENNVIIIDRSELDFSNVDDLNFVLDRIKE